VDTHIYSHIYKYIYIYMYIHTYTFTWHGTVDFFWRDHRPRTKHKIMREGTANNERQEGKCDRPGHCGILIENSSWKGRENRGPGGREGDAGADRNIDEGGEDENDGERERNTGERRRETEKREEKMKPEGRGRGSRQDETETGRTRGNMCCGEEGSERTPRSCLTTLYVQSGHLRVRGGRRVVVHAMANRRLHSKRKKRKALATHHVIRIMNSPIK
jgi:hypothetical protein